VSIRTGRTTAERRLEAKYQAPELTQHVSTWKEAKAWLTDRIGLRYYDEVKGLGHLSEEQRVELVNTLIDLDEKPTHLMGRIKNIRVKPDKGSSYHTGTWELNLDPNDGLSSEGTIDFIDRQLEYLEGQNTDYVRDLKEWKRQLEEGESQKAHTMYWFGEDRRIEGIMRHEAGHAFHEQYGNGNIYGDPGIDDLLIQSPDWKKDFSITSRGLDNWMECVAENFVAWSIGRTDLMNPKMVKSFDTLIRTKG